MRAIEVIFSLTGYYGYKFSQFSFQLQLFSETLQPVAKVLCLYIDTNHPVVLKEVSLIT